MKILNIFLVKGVFLVEGSETATYRLVYGNNKEDAETKFRYTYSDLDIIQVEVTDIIHINLP
jgi:hypothetical protein